MNPLEPTRYGSLEAQTHRSTLDLLREVADYLGRLPSHPAHHAMQTKLEEHLAKPSVKAWHQRTAIVAEDEVFRARVVAGNGFFGTSDSFMPNGLPVLTARLLYPVLRLESPAVRMTPAAGQGKEPVNLAASLAHDLGKGVDINLRSLDPVLDQRWLGR